MSSATILSGGSGGLYTISLDYGTVVRDALASRIAEDIAFLDTKIGEATTLLAGLHEITLAAAAAMNAAIDAYAEALAATTGTPEELAANIVATGQALSVAYRALGDAEAAEQGPRRLRDAMRADKATLQREAAAMAAVVTQETRQAWCVDLTEGGAGFVGTIDIPGESDAILIAAGCRPPNNGDGQLMAREVMSPAQAFFNAAILPGWQKFTPTYRKGTITAIDTEANTAGVSLDAATSSAQRLGINQASALSDVPVEYMTCHAAAFEVGDRCVVQFVGQSQSQPRVIGFVDNPRGCVRATVNYRINGVLVYTEEVWIGDTVIGWTAPATVSGFIDRPFMGWSDGVNSLAHPEIVTALPVTVYDINAEYVFVSDYLEPFDLIATHLPPNTYYPVYDAPPNEDELIAYMVQSHFSGIVYPQTSGLIDPIPVANWSGEYQSVATHLDPATVRTREDPVPVSAADAVGASFVVDGVSTRGWNIAITYSIAIDSPPYLAYYVQTAASATPP